MIRFERLTVLAILATVGSAISASGAQAECTLGAVAVLPITTQQGHLIFASDLNGQTLHFLFDTGAFATLLDREVAARAGVKLTDFGLVYGIGGSQRIDYGKAAHWRYGGLNADGQKVAAGDIGKITSATGVDAIFGMNMMAAYDVDLDLVGNHIVLYEADGNCTKPTVALAPELYSVPLEPIENHRQAVITLRIEGHRFRALLDTGAPSTTLYRDAAGHLGIDMSAMHAPGHMSVGGFGPFKVAAMT